MFRTSFIACALVALPPLAAQNPNLLSNPSFDASSASIDPWAFTDPAPQNPLIVFDDSNGAGVQTQCLEIGGLGTNQFAVGVTQSITLQPGRYRYGMTHVGRAGVDSVAVMTVETLLFTSSLSFGITDLEPGERMLRWRKLDLVVPQTVLVKCTTGEFGRCAIDDVVLMLHDPEALDVCETSATLHGPTFQVELAVCAPSLSSPIFLVASPGLQPLTVPGIPGTLFLASPLILVDSQMPQPGAPTARVDFTGFTGSLQPLGLPMYWQAVSFNLLLGSVLLADSHVSWSL